MFWIICKKCVVKLPVGSDAFLKIVVDEYIFSSGI